MLALVHVQSIAFLNCFGKLLEKIMAGRLSWLLEKLQLLYKDRIGGRPQRATLDAVMALVHYVEAANRRKLVTSALFMDVTGAFDNVSQLRLHNTLIKQGLLISLVN